MSEPVYDAGTQRLIADLECAPRRFDVHELLHRAKRLRYHDFDARGYDMPKIALVKHLRRAGLEELAQRAMDGAYDQPPEEARRWAESDEGQAVLEVDRDAVCHLCSARLYQDVDQSRVLASIRSVVGDGWFIGNVTHDVAVARKLGVLTTESENYHAALCEALAMLEAGDDAATVIAMLKGELVTAEDEE